MAHGVESNVVYKDLLVFTGFKREAFPTLFKGAPKNIFLKHNL